jgi:hypothetical protein
MLLAASRDASFPPPKLIGKAGKGASATSTSPPNASSMETGWWSAAAPNAENDIEVADSSAAVAVFEEGAAPGIDGDHWDTEEAPPPDVDDGYTTADDEPSYVAVEFQRADSGAARGCGGGGSITMWLLLVVSLVEEGTGGEQHFF